MRPLILSQYTSILDIDMWVYGGGQTGQTEATILALSKALVSFEPSLKRYFRSHNLLKTDRRNKERKKIGKKGARKGPVFKKR